MIFSHQIKIREHKFFSLEMIKGKNMENKNKLIKDFLSLFLFKLEEKTTQIKFYTKNKRVKFTDKFKKKKQLNYSLN